MDPLTHGLLGAATSQALFNKKLGKSCWIIGLLAAMAPDLDIFIRSTQDPLFPIIFHRQFTHSLLFIPLGGLCVALFLMCFPKFRTQRLWIVAAAVVAYATHSLLDACTSYGTQLYWPFSHARIAWDVIAIIDPLFTLILLFGVTFTAISNNPFPTRLSIGVCLLYLSFGYWQHSRALDLQTDLAKQRGHHIVKQRLMPTVANLIVWRSIYRDDKTIFIDEIDTPYLNASKVKIGSSVPLLTENNLPEFIRKDVTLFNQFKTFNWFSDSFTAMNTKQPFSIGDMHYIASLHPLVVLWGIQFPNPGKGESISWRYNLEFGNS